MKKILNLILFSVVTLLFLCSCSSGGTDDGKVKIVTTIFPQYDFARQIAGERASVEMLIAPGTESHNYEPTPKDIISIEECDIFIYVGGDSEDWVKRVLEDVNNEDMTVIALMEHSELHETEHDHDHGHDHKHYDEHVWTDPTNVINIVNQIRIALCEADPENEALYTANALDYIGKLEALDTAIENTVKDGERNLLVFGDRFPFAYFAHRYGIEHLSAFEGCTSEAEPIPSTIAEIIDTVKEEKIPVVFTIEFSNQKIAQSICEETGARILEFHSCHNVSADDFNSGVTYLDLMYSNLANLKEALN